MRAPFLSAAQPSEAYMDSLGCMDEQFFKLNLAGIRSSFIWSGSSHSTQYATLLHYLH